MTPVHITITADDGTDLDVTVTPLDPPDRAVGMLGWSYAIDAGRALSYREEYAVWAAVEGWRP